MRDSRRPLVALLALATGAGALAGCGGGGNDKTSSNDAENQIRALVGDLGKSARAGDGKRICSDLFTKNLRISVERASRKSCPAEVGRNLSRPDAKFVVQDVKVHGRFANATVTDQSDRTSNLLLQHVGDGWRIARIGS